jgi:hypothetical protein
MVGAGRDAARLTPATTNRSRLKRGAVAVLVPPCARQRRTPAHANVVSHGTPQFPLRAGLSEIR